MVDRELFKNRYFIAIVVFIIALSILLTRAFTMQVILGTEYNKTSDLRKLKTLAVSGMRGKILDSQGRVLAYDEKSYNIEFFRDKVSSDYREEYTNSIIKAINIIEKNGVKIDPLFSIIKNEKGKFAFDWGNVSASTAEKREEKWRENFYVSKQNADKTYKLTPKDIYNELRDRFKVPENLNDSMALKVLAIWQDSILSAYAAKPIIIARNVEYKVISEIGTDSISMPGIRIAEGTKRVYPYGSTAAHIIGYLGRISEYDMENFVNQNGYSPDDYVGVYGVEKVLEEYLTGNGKYNIGSSVLEVDNRGTVIQEKSYTNPQNGDNLVLTIDINLQNKLEQALAENIEIIRESQVNIYNKNKAEYEKLVKKRNERAVEFAQTGAAVVMDVNTGNVLAMASYPSFDLNIFARGITQTELDALIDDPRKPLFNNAISSRGAPGSIFKMVTGIAGLSEGVITTETLIEDKGEYKEHIAANSKDKGPMCWIYRANPGQTHGLENIEEAIKDSCNYFFFTVSDLLGINKLSMWGNYFGLDAKTNIELPNEVPGQVANPNVLYDPSKPINSSGTAKLVYKAISKEIKAAAEKSNAVMTTEEINAIVDEVFLLVKQSRNTILKNVSIMLNEKTKIKKNIIESQLKFDIADYLGEITWTSTNTITAGIGQSITMLSPIAVARYISALVNGGYVYDAHIVDKIVDDSGKVVMDMVPTVYRNLNIEQKYLDTVKLGMKDVVSGDDSSTARTYFKDFKYTDQMGGKTGTAQVSTINLENNSWFVSFVPFDKPEIAIVVYIPHGYSGGMSAHTNKQIVEYYMDNKQSRSPEAIINENEPLN